MNQNYFAFTGIALLAAILAPLSNARAQGSLTPPAGVPAPTMKTLAQIEPRIPIPALPFTISAAGSYYVTTNLTGQAASSGITILADNVTVDLNGFCLSGVAGSFEGVLAAGTLKNIWLRNGTITGWGDTGVNMQTASFSRVEQVRVYKSASLGMDLADNCVVTGCTANTNGLGGINILGGGVVENCTANFNVNDGISAGAVAMITGCSAQRNGSCGIVCDRDATIKNCSTWQNVQQGIRTSLNGMVADCSSISNLAQGIYVVDGSAVTGCLAGQNGFQGISGKLGCSVKDCTAFGNTGSGIDVGSGGAVTGCSAYGNLVTSSYGVLVSGNSVVKDCMVVSNYIGMASGSNCTVTACSASVNRLFGMTTGDNCVVRDSSICNNGSSGVNVGNHCTFISCVANGNAVSGLEGFTSVRVTVTGCTANQNGGFGIRVGSDSMVTGSHASTNGTLAAHSAGIYSLGGTSSRLEENQVRDNNGYGIQAGTTDVVIRNYAGGNSTNFQNVSGVNFGPVQTPAAATSPVANVAY